MIKVGIKKLCHIEKEEIIVRAHTLSPFYCEYILSPIGEKESRERLLHSAHRLAAVELLWEFCKHNFAEMPKFLIKNTGKPYFEGECGVHFSFSHSGDIAVCAVSLPDASDGESIADERTSESKSAHFCLTGGDFAGEFCIENELCLTLNDVAHECIGVDIQASKKGALCYNHEKVAQRFFDTAMLELLEKDKSESNFTSLWCELESLAKMTGDGVASYDRKNRPLAKTLHAKITDTNGDEYHLALSYR